MNNVPSLTDSCQSTVHRWSPRYWYEILYKYVCSAGGQQEEKRENSQKDRVWKAWIWKLSQNPRGPDHDGQAAHGTHRVVFCHQLLCHHQCLGIHICTKVLLSFCTFKQDVFLGNTFTSTWKQGSLEHWLAWLCTVRRHPRLRNPLSFWTLWRPTWTCCSAWRTMSTSTSPACSIMFCYRFLVI